MKSSDPVDMAVATIGAARRMNARFASGAGFLGTCHLNRMLRQANCNIVYFPFQSQTGAIVLPLFDGAHPTLINANAPREERIFAELHELHHVLAGEADELVQFSRDDYMCGNERAADLFALAELVPSFFMRDYQSDEVLHADVCASIETHVIHWPADRVRDRADLRLRLFHEWDI